jgi:flagellar basal body-associated protein FliL
MSAINNQDSGKSESKNNNAAILWTVIILALIAVGVGIMPFFYLNNAVING